MIVEDKIEKLDNNKYNFKKDSYYIMGKIATIY